MSVFLFQISITELHCNEWIGRVLYERPKSDHDDVSPRCCNEWIGRVLYEQPKSDHDDVSPRSCNEWIGRVLYERPKSDHDDVRLSEMLQLPAIPESSVYFIFLLVNFVGHCEPATTSAPWRMNGKWSRNSFLLGFSSLANHGGQLWLHFVFLPTY
jgi:hypothetical protein